MGTDKMVQEQVGLDPMLARELVDGFKLHGLDGDGTDILSPLETFTPHFDVVSYFFWCCLCSCEELQYVDYLVWPTSHT